VSEVRLETAGIQVLARTYTVASEGVIILLIQRCSASISNNLPTRHCKPDGRTMEHNDLFA